MPDTMVIGYRWPILREYTEYIIFIRTREEYSIDRGTETMEMLFNRTEQTDV